MADKQVNVRYSVDYKDVEGLNKEIEKVNQSQAEWQAGNNAVKKSMQAVTGSLDKQRQNLRSLDAAVNQLRNSGRQLTEGQKGQLAALRQTAAQQRLNIQSQRQLEREQKKATKAITDQKDAIDLNIKKLLLWGVGVRTTFALFNKLRRELSDVFQELHGGTPEMEAFNDAVKQAEYAFVAALTPSEDVKNILSFLAQGFTALGQVIALTGALFAGFIENIKVSLEDIKQVAEGAPIEELGISTEEAERITNAYNKSLKATVDAMNQASTATKDFSQTLDGAANAYKRLTDEEERHRQALADITLKYGGGAFGGMVPFSFGTEQVKAMKKYQGKLEDIQDDLNKRLAKIEADALKAREKARANYHKRIAAAEKQAGNDLARMIEQHELEMRFARQRYNLTNIQNERLYLYERERLLAEGDVLAIEELDARYELEKQAREENFRLQQQQAEAMFQLQLKYQQEAMKEQIQALKDALGEQLAAIEQQRIEERAEAEAKAEEERIRAQEARDKELEDAAKAGEEARKQEEENHQKKLEDLADFWAQYLIDSEIGLKDGLALFNKVMGLNGELDSIITESYKRNLQFTINFTNDYERIMGSVPEAARNAANAAQAELDRIISGAAAAIASMAMVGGATGALAGARGRGAGYYGGSYYGSGYRQQFGGEHVVSQPTTFTAGERGMRERVIVQPLSPIAASGNLGLQWSGGPIPVRGEGSLSGMDVQALADSISVGVLNKLTATFGSRYGIRGR